MSGNRIFHIGIVVLLAATALTLSLELAGVRTRVFIRFDGDIWRNSRWVAEHGEAPCVIVASYLIWQLDRRRRRAVWFFIAAVMLSALCAKGIKHVTGRPRPSFGTSQQFTGPFLGSDPKRESFPSAHTAAAVACSVFLARLYPRARWTLWILALACGVLRWIDGAHWLSDVLAGAALGWMISHLAWRLASLPRTRLEIFIGERYRGLV